MKKAMKKSLSVFLALVMVLTSSVVGLSGITALAYTASELQTVKPAGEAATSSVTLIVPEQIYLAPDALSWKDASSTPFQYYVNNDENGDPVQNEMNTDTGHIYIKGLTANQKQYATLSVSAITEDGGVFSNAATANLATVAGVTLSTPTTTTDNFTEHPATADSEYYLSADITGGVSPSLAAATNGYYLLWKLSYNYPKTVDGVSVARDKATYALTYVYKPYTVPVAAAAGTRLGNETLKYDVTCQDITWLTGFHSIKENLADLANRDAGSDSYYLCYGDDANGVGFAAFSTPNDDAAYIGSQAIDSNTRATALYQYLGTPYLAQGITTALRGLPYWSQSKNTSRAANFYFPDNSSASPGQWKDASTKRYDKINFRWNKRTNTPSGAGSKFTTSHETCPSAAALTIDTSRYTDLRFIPNLTAGFGIVDFDRSDGNNTCWSVADVSQTTGTTGTSGGQRNNCVVLSDSSANYPENVLYRGSWGSNNDSIRCDQDLKAYTIMIAGEYQTANSSTPNSGTPKWVDKPGFENDPCIRYVGPWTRPLITTSTELAKTYNSNDNYVNYYIKGFGYESKTGHTNYAGASSILNLQAAQFSKSAVKSGNTTYNLRSLVKQASDLMNKLGVNGYDGTSKVLTSCFFNSANTNSGWKTFSDAFMAAAKALTRLDATKAECFTAAQNLSNAMGTIKTQVHFELNNDRYPLAQYNPQSSFNSNPWVVINPTTEQSSAAVAVPTAQDIAPMTGYVYKGVSTDKNAASTDAVLTAQTVGFNETYYLIFLAKPVTFTFQANGGSAISPITSAYGENPNTIGSGADAKMINIPTWTGHVFEGFYDGGTQVIDEFGRYVKNGGIVDYDDINADSYVVDLQARWHNGEYTLNVTREGVQDPPRKFTYDDEINSPTSGVILSTYSSNDGMQFDAYYIDGTDTAFTDSNGRFLAPNDQKWMTPNDVSVTARFRPREYTVMLNHPDGKAGIGDNDVTMTYGQMPPTIVPPQRDGFTFLGYFTRQEKGLGQKIYEPNGSAVNGIVWDDNTKTITNLYAQWEERTYNFYYTNDDATGQQLPILFRYGELLGDRNVKPAEPTGQHFNGYFSADGSIQYVNSSGNFLHATWDYLDDVYAFADFDYNDYEIRLDNQGGVGAWSLQVTYNSNVPDLAAVPQFTGHTFLGFYDSLADNATQIIDAAGHYNHPTNGNKYLIADNSDLYAHWETITYTVTFNSKSGNGANESYTATVPYGQPMAGTDQTRRAASYYDSNNHYTFSGTWLRNGTAFDMNTPITEDIVLTADYTGTQHNISTTPIHTEPMTCIHDGYNRFGCSDCDYTYDVTIPINLNDDSAHDWEKQYSQNRTCQQAGIYTYVCRRDASHTKPGGTEPANKHNLINITNSEVGGVSYHTGHCTICNQDITEQCFGGEAPNCQSGSVCITCGHEYTDKDGSNHVSTAIYTKAGEVRVEPSCKTDGHTAIIRHKCCDAIISGGDLLPATGRHNWSVTDDIVYDPTPTCETPGKAYHYCKTCGEKQEPGWDVIGHHTFDESQTQIEHERDCIYALQYKKYCTTCGKWITVTVGDPAGHKYVSSIWVDNDKGDPNGDPPTCLTGGWQHRDCDIDGAAGRIYQYLDPLGHQFEKVPAKEADCSHTGTREGWKCARCGEWKDGFNPNDPANIVPVDPDKHTDFDHDGYCDDCDREITEDYDYEGDCGCICHMAEHSFICKIVYAICRLFWRLFNYNRTCICGAEHWAVKG